MNRALHLVASGVARYAGQLAVFALVAVVLGPDQAGRYALALAVTAPIFVVAGLGLRPVFLTISPRVAARSAETLRAAASTLALGATIVAAAAVADASTALLVSVVAASKAVDTFAELWSALLQATGRHRRLSGSTALATVAQIAAVGAALTGGAGVSGAVAAGTGAVLLVSVVATRPRAGADPRILGSGARSGDWRRLLAAGVPAGIASGVATLVTTLPQYVLGRTAAPADVAELALLLYVVAGVQIVLNGFAQAWIPEARDRHETARLTARHLAATTLRWSVASVPTAVVGAGLMLVVVPLVLGPGHALGVAELAPLIIAASLSAPVFCGTTALTVQNRYTASLGASIVTVLVAGAAGLVVVPVHGGPGALWVTVAAMATRVVVAWLLAATPAAPPAVAPAPGAAA